MHFIEISNIFKSEKKRYKVTAVLKLLVVFALLGFFLSNKPMYHVQTDFYLKRMGFVFLACFWMVFVTVCDIRLSQKVDRAFVIILGVIAPVMGWILSEFLINEAECAFPPTQFYQKEPLWIVLSLAMIILVDLLIIFLTNSIRVGSVIVPFVLFIFAVVVCVVYEFRGIPMMAPDILTVQTATSVMGNYTFKLTFEQYSVILVCMAFFFTFLRLHEVKVTEKRVFHIAGFIVVALGCGLFTNQIILSDFMEEHQINIRMFRPMESYQKYGGVLTFARSVGYAVVKKPEGYTTAKVDQIIQEYEKKSANEQQSTAKQYPNIITVVNETFADIKVLGDFKTNEDYMPYFHSLKKNCVTGYTYASIVGGQTANTEFELLTGNTLGFLSAGTTAFQLYIHGQMPSLVSNLKVEGYSGNKAMHPFNPYNYNRPAVYKDFGFTDFIDKFDFPKNVKRVREYISDEANVDRIISEYEKNRKKTDQPFYMYNMTIQNHSPYDKDAANFKQPIKIESSKYDAEANRYLNLIKYSDDSLKQLTGYFEKCKEPTIILFLGDHQPRLTDEFMNKITNGQYQTWSSEQMMKRYQVPFVIWANYDIKEQHIEKTSMNYIQSILTKTAGVKMTGYQRFLNEVRKEVPTITSQGYWGKNGKFYQINDKGSPYYGIIQKYRMIQYNMMFDKKNRRDSFFEVSKQECTYEATD